MTFVKLTIKKTVGTRFILLLLLLYNCVRQSCRVVLYGLKLYCHLSIWEVSAITTLCIIYPM